MSANTFLTLTVGLGWAVIAGVLTVAIAGPTTPTARPAQPTEDTTNDLTEHLPAGAQRCAGECRATGLLCRFHRGFAAGWIARGHHQTTTAPTAGAGNER